MEPTWTSDCGTVRLWMGDCLAVMASWPDGAVDAVVTDPPYGIGASFGVGGPGRKATTRAWGDAWDCKCADVSFVHSFRQAVVFGFQYMADQLGNCKSPFVWDKKCRNGWEDNFADCEIAWTKGIGGPPRCFRYQWMGACRGANARDGKKVHPTQKPLSVMERCVQFTDGQTIADPFMGSGTTGVAAVRLGRKFWGVEIDPKYFEIAKRRIQDELRRVAFLEGRASGPRQTMLPMEASCDAQS